MGAISDDLTELDRENADGAGPGSGGPEAPDERLERALGHTEPGRAANGALRALARAARSFLVYDAHNEAIKTFLGEYRACIDRAVAFGPLDLEVRPFELLRDGEVVYVERDRDRSLAFRLFRDGVRRLCLQPGVEWPELLRLLEILSIRYTGVRQYEDDTVTLLWKAGCRGISLSAVEGFVLADDDDGDGAPGGDGGGAAAAELRRAGPTVEVPADWDRPSPAHAEGDPAALRRRTIKPAVLAALRDEVASTHAAHLAVRLCRELLELVADPTDPTRLSDVAGLLDEVRGMLLADGQLGALLELTEAVAALTAAGGDEAEAAARELARFGDLSAWRKILRSFERHEGALPPELFSLAARVGGDPLPLFLGLADEAQSRGVREAVGALIGWRLTRSGGGLLEAAAGATDPVAAELLRQARGVRPAQAPGLALALVDRDHTELQGLVREVLSGMPSEQLHKASVLRWLRSPDRATRLLALNRVEKVVDKGDLDTLVAWIEGLPRGSRAEAMAAGEALVRLDPDRALEVLVGWVRPRQLWDRVVSAATEPVEPWAGVAGLAKIDGEYAASAIRGLQARAEPELAALCARALAGRAEAPGAGPLAEGAAVHHAGLFKHAGRLVLSPQMLCFEPEGGRWRGAKALDLPVQRLRSSVAHEAEGTLTVDVDGELHRFSGPGAAAAAAPLAALLRARQAGARAPR